MEKGGGKKQQGKAGGTGDFHFDPRNLGLEREGHHWQGHAAVKQIRASATLIFIFADSSSSASGLNVVDQTAKKTSSSSPSKRFRSTSQEETTAPLECA
ncbi:MAG: hypothetical protein ABSE51_24145 [Terracidiphilus sp.]